MNAIPPSVGTGSRPTSRRATVDASAARLRWAALGDAGSVVAALAGVPPGDSGQSADDFHELIDQCPGWRRELVESSIADLAAIMEPGLAALLAVNGGGGDPRPAAQALWREYSAARAAILDLLQASEA